MEAVRNKRRERKRRLEAKRNAKWVVRGLILPVSVLIIWQIAGSLDLISKTLLPAPLVILQAFIDLIFSGELFKHLEISVYRAVAGFLLGGGLGLLLGLMSGLFRRAEETLDPTVQMLRLIPHLAITPLFILWFGFGELSKVLLIAKGAFFPLYVNTFLGIRSADSKLFDVARILEFSRWKQITRLVIPAAMPNLLLGLRLSLGIAWLGLVVAELMGVKRRDRLLDYGCQAVFPNRDCVCRHHYFCRRRQADGFAGAAVGEEAAEVARQLQRVILTDGGSESACPLNYSP